MPEIYMDHPEHGATCVFDTGDQTRLEGYGWKVRGAEAAPAKPDTLPVDPPPAPKGKPGRKPKG